jgi:imidazolonepropionase-like amidohydrolase
MEGQMRREDQMRRVNVITLTAAAVILGFAVPASAQTGVTVFEGARIITGNEAAPIENGTLVIQGTRILQVGKAGEVQVPAGATRVNAVGKTIMPTVVDTHTHLSTNREGLIKDLKRRAYYGVSAAISLGTDGFGLLDMRDEKIPGAARYFSAGLGITRFEPGPPKFQINSEAEGRRAVQQNAAHRVDMIKVWVDDRDGKVDKVTPLQYAAIIDEAHKRGLRVTAHIFNMEDGKGLIRAGLDLFAHGVRDRDIDDETVALFRAHPYLTLTPNLPDRGVKVDNSWLKASLSADEYGKLEKDNTDRPKAQEFYGIQARNLNRLARAGVRIAMGTDGNRPWGPHEEMADMVTAGMTPMQVIIASTRNSAGVLRITDSGTLDPGMSADFMLLDANPLEDIHNTRTISSVYLHGAVVDRSVPIN